MNLFQCLISTQQLSSFCLSGFKPMPRPGYRHPPPNGCGSPLFGFHVICFSFGKYALFSCESSKPSDRPVVSSSTWESRPWPNAATSTTAATTPAAAWSTTATISSRTAWRPSAGTCKGLWDWPRRSRVRGRPGGRLLPPSENLKLPFVTFIKMCLFLFLHMC